MTKNTYTRHLESVCRNQCRKPDRPSRARSRSISFSVSRMKPKHHSAFLEGEFGLSASWSCSSPKTACAEYRVTNPIHNGDSCGGCIQILPSDMGWWSLSVYCQWTFFCLNYLALATAATFPYISFRGSGIIILSGFIWALRSRRAASRVSLHILRASEASLNAFLLASVSLV